MRLGIKLSTIIKKIDYIYQSLIPYINFTYIHYKLNKYHLPIDMIYYIPCIQYRYGARHISLLRSSLFTLYLRGSPLSQVTLDFPLHSSCFASVLTLLILILS